MSAIETKGFDKAYDLLTKTLPKQTAFATRKTINQCLEQAQRFTTESLISKNQTIRTKWFAPGRKFGFNARFATATRPEGRMGTAAEWEGLQEEGGTKTPKNQFITVPLNARPAPTSIIPRRLRAKALKARGTSFIVTSKAGDKLLINRERGGKTTVMYVFKPDVRVKPVLHFSKENEKIVEDSFPSLFAVNFAQAMATAR
jgi:hypothetical protein